MRGTPVRRLLTVLGAAGLTGCDSVIEPALVVTISLSIASVTLQPGASEHVVLTILPQAGGVQLAVGEVPAGLSATLSPEFLAARETQSVLTVAADPAALPGDATLTISAARGDATGQATLKLQILASPCPGYAIPSSCPPFPTGGTGVVSGVLRERSGTGTHPLGGASVWAWFQLTNHGYNGGRVQTNSNGE